MAVRQIRDYLRRECKLRAEVDFPACGAGDAGQHTPPRRSDDDAEATRRCRLAAPDRETGPRRNLEESIVRNTSIILGTLIVLALAGVSHAQRPANITREMIATALPVEGAPLAVPGPYKVESGPAFGSPGHVVYRPADLTPFPGKDTLPLMVWGNGGCAINSTRYGGFLTTIASHGFVVMATAAEPGAAGGSGHRRQPAQSHRLGRSREQARRVAAQRQDRARPCGGHGPVVRRLPVARTRSRSARGHDRRVQLGRAGGQHRPARPRCTVRCCSSTATSATS